MSFYSSTNLVNSPYAERMAPGQRREFFKHLNPNREIPAWVLELVAKQQTEPEVRQVLDEYLQAEAEEEVIKEEWEAQQEELRDEYPLFTEYLARREFETEKERAEAEAEFVAEYHAWVAEMLAWPEE